MTIIDLLQRAGVDNIKYQMLLSSLCNISTNKRGVSRITFETDQINASDVLANDGDWVGIVVWVPGRTIEEARRKIQSAKAKQ